jgi:hypothetical protein
VLIPGKQWKAQAAPNKNAALRTSFSKRITKNKQLEGTKGLERQLNEERKTAETVHSFSAALTNRKRKKHQRPEKRPERRRSGMSY